MTFFDAIYDKLFKKRSANGILSQEPLTRTEKEQQDFQTWLNTEEPELLLKKIHHSYHLKKTDIEGDIPILLFQSIYANGFAVKNNSFISRNQFSLLLDYFRHSMLNLGYRQAGSDRRHTAKNGYVVSVDKFYMKPPLQTQAPIDQLYGNVAIELHFFNDEPNFLKVMASIYSDRMYKEHLDFDDLVEQLLMGDSI